MTFPKVTVELSESTRVESNGPLTERDWTMLHGIVESVAEMRSERQKAEQPAIRRRRGRPPKAREAVVTA